MYIDHDSLSDTNMRWKGTVIRVNENGSLVPVLVKQVLAADKKSVVIKGTIDRGGWLPVQMEIPVNMMEFSFPTLGYFNTKAATYLLTRLSVDRLYYLGFHPKRVSMRAPNSEEVRYVGLPSALDPMDVLKELYRPRTYANIAEAHKQILAGKLFGAGISPSIAMAASMFSERVSLFRHNKFIGDMENEKVARLAYRHKFFSDELSELGLEIMLVRDEENGKKAK